MQLCKNVDTKNSGKYTDDYFYKKYFADQQIADSPKIKVDDRSGTGPRSTEEILGDIRESNLAERLKEVLSRGGPKVDPRTYLGYNQESGTGDFKMHFNENEEKK